ncbi:MAG: hypothetical protein J6Q47_03190 [Paludibacteraceae bacterium]|nr:hypothetical protein [Paludibacteraceae bacterium]
MKKQNLLHIIFFIGYICIVTGAAVQLFELSFAPYVFSIGVALAIIFRFLTTVPSSDVRTKRLNRMLAISAVLLLISAYFMFTNSNLWALTIVIAMVFDLVVSFRFPT